jgi:hypothetical protein
MANVNAPFGFRPVKHATGGEIKHREYTIASGGAFNIGYGDPVEMTGTGKNIQLAAATNVDNIGIFCGVDYIDSTGEHKFSRNWVSGTTGTNIKALVIDDPDVIYECQADACAEADVGLLSDWTIGTVDSFGRSTTVLKVSTGATTGQSFRVLELVPDPANAYGNYANVRVMWAEHVLKGVVSGVGGI